MVPTLRTVLALPGRPVVLRVGADALDRPVRWVAVSELEDPTPYLQGEELLLTTGIRLVPDRFDEYVRRLVGAGVAALGLGVGLTHAVMPSELVAAAERHGLPLIEVPEPTPFIAISKAVSDVLAAEEYEAVSRAVEAQRDLTRAALAPEGAAVVVNRLATELGALVWLLDPAGGLLHTAPRPAPASAEGLADQVVAEVEQMRARGARTSSSFSDEAWSTVIQPLAPAGRVRGYLAASRHVTFSPVDHSLVNVGVAVLSLTLEQPAGSDAARGQLRAAVVELLVSGIAPSQLPLASVGWEGLLSGPVRVLLADGDSGELAALQERLEEPAQGVGPRGVARLDERLVVLVPDTAGAETAAVGLGPGLAWGISDPVPADGLAEGLRQARRAVAAAGACGERRFHDLARDGLLGLVDAEAARGFADSLLGPLDARDRGDLVASVRAWLAHHGQWDAAAGTLGVHRHTLRYRMRRVEELLGRSLDDPDLRADLWLAVAVRDRDAAE